MKRVFGIVVLIGMIYVSAMMVGYAQYMRNDVKELGQLRLSYAIDHAGYAAAQAMLKTPDLGMDYTNPNYEKVDPNIALDTFLTVMCINYDMTPTDSNKKLIANNYVPMAAVAGVDGYYIATPRLIKNSVNSPEGAIKNGDWDLIFGMKMPYTYKYNGTAYALNMTMNNCLALSGGSLTKEAGLPPTSTGILSQQEAWRVINSEVSTDMAYTLDKANQSDPGWSNSFFIPSEVTTFSGVNPIKGPTFMALVENLKLDTSTSINAFSVAGTKIIGVRAVVGYTRNAIKYYCYADEAPSTAVIEHTFSTVKEAASAGYYFDTQYMQ